MFTSEANAAPGRYEGCIGIGLDLQDDNLWNDGGVVVPHDQHQILEAGQHLIDHQWSMSTKLNSFLFLFSFF